MSDFLGSDFLLQSPVSRMLYREHAASKPIIDYHCHLDPALIAADRRFASITALWLGGDHYKWRAMRANGVNERFITGDASDWEKFEKWAETVPYTFRNPLYHWTHMELRTAFGIDETLNPESARRIFDECNAQLRDKESMTPAASPSVRTYAANWPGFSTAIALSGRHVGSTFISNPLSRMAR